MLKQALKTFLSLLLFYFIVKKQKKVLLVAEFEKSGGTRTYFIYLIQFLHRKGYEVLVLPSNNIEDDEITKILEKLKYKVLPANFDFWSINLQQIPEHLTKAKLIRYQLTELRHFCYIQRKHNFSSFIFSVAYPEKYLYAFLLPVRITYILHTAPSAKTDEYKLLLLRLFLNSHKQILTVSNFAKKSIEQFWLRNKQSNYVKYVHNYYATKYTSRVTKRSQSVKKILTIGSVEKYKNPMLFVETAKKIIAGNKDEVIEFVWAGDGSLLNECREACFDYPQIRFIGNVTNVDPLYMEATIYFQPSLIESHGIATLGAMYHQLPCVVSIYGGLKESVVDGITGFVIPVNNIEASVEKINFLLNNELRCRKMGEFGSKIFRSRFSEHVWNKKMKSIF